MRLQPLKATLLAIMMSAPLGAALANDIPEEFEIGTATFDDWKLQAFTSLRTEYRGPGGVNFPDGIPFYRNSNCLVQSPTFLFEMNDRLEIKWFGMKLDQFSTPEGEIMPERRFDMYLDDQRFEIGYKRKQSSKLTNFDYPAIYESTPGFIGYMAFRPVEYDHWLPLTRLFDRLLNAETAHVGMLPLPDETEPQRRYDPALNSSSMTLDIDGLKQASQWCAQTMKFPAATTLPAPEGQPK